MVILMLLFPVSSILADTSGQRLPEKEAILQEARGLIDQSPTKPANLRQAISLLEGYSPRFPNEVRFPLYLAEAYYRLADPSADVSREFPYYEKTATYAKKVLEINPNRIEGHYWYGLFLLKKAQKRGIRGYFTVKQGIAELEKVRQAMPSYDHAGASRVLGLLYSLAPSWTPFGNLDKSIQLGQEATRLAPDYALNRLYLADAYKKRGDTADAIREYQAILTASAREPGNQAEGLSQQARNGLRSLDQPI
jgi:tetratricopeptide (TPR) repeat protein